MASTDALRRIEAETAAFGAPTELYQAAVRDLLDLDEATKTAQPARYLDAYVNLLLRLQDNWANPWLDAPTVDRVRAEAVRWSGSDDPEVAANARNVVDNLPA